MRRHVVADLAMTASIITLGGSLLFSGAALLRRTLANSPARSSLDLAEIIGAMAAGLGLAIVLWWLVALAAAVVSAVAGRHGRLRLAARAASFSPLFLRRLVAVVLGVQLLGTPLAMADGGSGPIDPQWAPAMSQPAAVPIPGPSTPDTGGIDPRWTPNRPAADPGILAPSPSRPDTAIDVESDDDSVAATVVVRAGDSLWSIAADSLGPFATDMEVAGAWPEWYRSNRAVIGPDPHLILPGQILHAPTD